MTERPLLVCLHALGGSGRWFTPLTAALGERAEVLAPDLPGFGDAAADPAATPEDTAAFVLDLLRARPGRRFVLVGHSMGGKFASIAASQVLAGAPGVFGLAGVVLLAGSPPAPEPMAEGRREKMVQWATAGAPDAVAAREFVDANVGSALPADLDAVAVEDVSRCAGTAWRAWLERGSREDWSQAVGVLDVPALVVAGGADGDLGPDNQRRLHSPVYPRAQFETLAGAGHLLPLERPTEVADLLVRFWTERAGRGPAVPVDTGRVIASDHTNSRTRAVYATRALADHPDPVPQVFDAAQLATLRAVAGRVVPQDGPPVDLAARLDAQLAAGEGNGWRPDVLPPDAEAYRTALAALAGFEQMTPAAQDSRLAAVAAGEYDAATDRMTAQQFAAWFEDTRDDLVRLWLGHPATLARIGFDGFATGGDGVRQQGFTLVGAGEREGWEPLPLLPVRAGATPDLEEKAS